jgi:hypothetical protein
VTLPISLPRPEASLCRLGYKTPDFLWLSNLQLYEIGTITLPKVQIGSISLPKVQIRGWKNSQRVF